jgi:L-lactate dehydrogenase complex protein LldG
VNARDEILARIRDGLRDAEPPPAQGPSSTAAPEDFESHAERVSAFCRRLTAADGHVRMVADEEQAAAALREIVEKAGAAKIALSDAPLVQRLAGALDSVDLVEASDRAGLLEADLGVSGAQHAIAETGTLVLETRREQNRLVSLLPPLHVAVLHADNLLATLGDALAAVSKEGLSRGVTFITGPSRTADIELVLVVGVHGPRELHVILIDPRHEETAS